MHTVTVSYRESEAATWGKYVPAILASFRFESGAGVPPSGFSWPWVLLISAVLTWGIGLAPPLLVRFVLVRKPISKGIAIAICVGFLVLNVALFAALGSTSKTHSGLFFVAVASYFISRKKRREVSGRTGMRGQQEA